MAIVLESVRVQVNINQKDDLERQKIEKVKLSSFYSFILICKIGVMIKWWHAPNCIDISLNKSFSSW